ncbi:dihydropteroate synthase [Maribacter algicola]|uniref:Dihydropteroate synthase n=1 Tax=Meishania litoralis TaxID=3434685 RepID=A0ACC7LG32_9FLAO
MTINCKGNLVDLSAPKVMGILNVTPDSFYDGGRYSDIQKMLSHVEKMLNDGATFVDIGAYSSRPGADPVSEVDELSRLLPIVEALLKEFPEILLSIDTFRSNVAEQCLHRGAALVNDISAGKLDEKMLSVIARFKVPCIMMHMRGNPRTMSDQTQYDDLIEDIHFYFSERLAMARKMGLNDMIIDPGFGFAKTLRQNYELLQDLDLFQSLDVPVLVGLSRKSMIYKTLKSDPENALNGTTALNMLALSKGAKILRVHDVKEAMECVQLYNQMS